MRLPRDISGEQLSGLLHRYGYEVTRQTGSHIRLTSTTKGKEHHITIPAHKQLSADFLGATLNAGPHSASGCLALILTFHVTQFSAPPSNLT